MKNRIVVSALGLFAAGAAVQTPAQAGCITGAVVGGIAGHFVGHSGLGAAAGCAYGMHKNHQAKKNQQDEGRSRVQQPNSNGQH